MIFSYVCFSQQQEEKAESSNKWEKTAFQDDKTQAKFRRLMGIKEDEDGK